MRLKWSLCSRTGPLFFGCSSDVDMPSRRCRLSSSVQGAKMPPLQSQIFYQHTTKRSVVSPDGIHSPRALSKMPTGPRTTYTNVSWFLNRLRPRSLVVELASLCELLHAAPDAQVVIECLDNPHRHRANGKDEIDEAWQADHVATAYGGLHHALDHIVGLQNGQHVWFPVG